MQNKLDDKLVENEKIDAALRSLSPAEFAALGTGDVAFVRAITGRDLARLIPQADIDADDAVVQLLMAADGTPVMVTDTQSAIDDWLEDKSIVLATLH